MTTEKIYQVSARNWHGDKKVAELLERLEPLGVQIFRNPTDSDHKYIFESDSEKQAERIYSFFKSAEDLMGGIVRLDSQLKVLAGDSL